MITPIAKIEGLLTGIGREDLQRIPPVHRQWRAQALRRVADLCDPQAKPDLPKSGVPAAVRESA